MKILHHRRDVVAVMHLLDGITHWLISTQEFPENFKGTPMLSCSVTPGRTYAPCAYFTTHGLWLGRSETA